MKITLLLVVLILFGCDSSGFAIVPVRSGRRYFTPPSAFSINNNKSFNSRAAAINNNKSFNSRAAAVPGGSTLVYKDALSKRGVFAIVGATSTGTILLSFTIARSDWRSFFAGGICASLSHVLATPLDVIKTRQQLDETACLVIVNQECSSKGFLETAKNLISSGEGATLTTGIGPTAVGYFIEGGMKYGAYEAMKLVFSKKIGFISYFLSAALSGLLASIVLLPIERIRIRLVAENTDQGWMSAGFKILKREGASPLIGGLNAMILKQVPYTVSKNVGFDLFTRILYAGPNFAAATTFLSAFFSSIVCCLASQPGDTLLTAVSVQTGGQQPERTRDIVTKIFKKNGVTGFFTGLRARFIHVGLIVTIQLLIYKVFRQALGLP